MLSAQNEKSYVLLKFWLSVKAIMHSNMLCATQINTGKSSVNHQ